MDVHVSAQLKELLRPLTEAELESLRAKLRRDGCTERLPYCVIDGNPYQLDGHHRRAICTEEKIAFEWQLVKSVTTLAEAKEWMREHQAGRRNLTAQEMTKLRAERRERVASARAKGESTRAIAEAEGVAEATVRGDLKANGQVRTPAHVTVGRDGKTYGSGPTNAAGLPVTDKQDAYGNPIPKCCKDAWGDPWLRRVKDLLAETGAALRRNRLIDGIKHRRKAYPFINAKDFIDACGMIDNTIDLAIKHLKENEPAGVCPKCHGKGCGKCKGAGLVPRHVYEELVK